MAFFLQIQNFQNSKNRIALGTNQSQWNFGENILQKVCEIFRGKQSIIVKKQLDTAKQKIVMLEIKLNWHVSILCHICLSSYRQRCHFKISLLHQNMYWSFRSNEIFKNICWATKTINKMIHQSRVFLAVDPGSRKIQVKISTSAVPSSSPQFQLAKDLFCLSNSLKPLSDIATILLYSSNLVPHALMKVMLKASLKKAFYGLNMEFDRYSEVYNLLPLVTTQSANKEHLNFDYNIKRFLNGRLAQSDHMHLNLIKICQIYAQELPFPTQNSLDIQRQLSQLHYPSYKDDSKDVPFVFNTIHITQHHKNNEVKIFEGGKGKIIASPCKFIFAQSLSTNQERRTQSTSEEDSSESIFYSRKQVKQKYQLQKTFLIKMPLEGTPSMLKKRLFSIIYEKEMLCNFRTSKCRYLCRYYQTIQQNYDYRHYLLMEFVPGLTLSDEIALKSETMSLNSKLTIISHISNAIRFLEEYQVSHLDITPSNIIVEPTGLIKLIDFGEAYHPVISNRYSVDSKRTGNNGFVYSPGRTFPYAPPETSWRITKFTSQQDIFSLGVILNQLLFGCIPINCSEQVLKRLYLQKDYASRLVLAPQRAEYYGEINQMLILVHLVVKLLQPNERKRPLPLWAFIIIKKLLYSIR